MNDDFLRGKKILFIGIGFYDYDEHIIKKLQEMGTKVKYFRDYPILNIFEYVKKKIFPQLEKKIVNRYYQEILKFTNEEYDYILIIKGENLSESFIENLRNKHENSYFILYQWDSIKRLKNFHVIKKYFNKILTFDRLDSLEYDYKFRPLFFKDIYFSNEINEKKYDIFFSGYLHSDRYQILRNLINVNKNLKIKYHLYVRKIEFLKEQIKFFLKKQKLYDSNLVKFFSINDLENKKLMSQSKAILDLHHPLQSGLTIRTIESIAMGNKIITTNKDIKNYEFYCASKICIVERENVEIPLNFFKNIDNIFTTEQKNKYSLRQWILDVFEK